MTEKEARKRWCPMARIRDDEENGLSVNRHSEHGIPISCMCMGSECMMWVATDNECEPQPYNPNTSAVPPEPVCHPAGHCGLVK